MTARSITSRKLISHNQTLETHSHSTRLVTSNKAKDSSATVNHDHL